MRFWKCSKNAFNESFIKRKKHGYHKKLSPTKSARFWYISCFSRHSIYQAVIFVINYLNCLNGVNNAHRYSDNSVSSTIISSLTACCFGSWCCSYADNVGTIICVDYSNACCFVYVKEYSFIDKMKDAYHDIYIDDIIYNNLLDILLNYNHKQTVSNIHLICADNIHVYNSWKTDTNINCNNFRVCQPCLYATDGVSSLITKDNSNYISKYSLDIGNVRCAQQECYYSMSCIICIWYYF